MKVFKYYSIHDLIIIAIMAAIGVAIKPIVSSLTHSVTAALAIPGGALAGGLYMMWLVLAYAITGKYGSATLVGVIQAIIMIIAPVPGSHGILSLFTYTLPGIAIDVLLIIIVGLLKCNFEAWVSFLCGLVANLTGSLATSVIFFHLPPLFIVLVIVSSATSGGIGGLLAWGLFRIMKEYRMVKR